MTYPHRVRYTEQALADGRELFDGVAVCFGTAGVASTAATRKAEDICGFISNPRLVISGAGTLRVVAIEATLGLKDVSFRERLVEAVALGAADLAGLRLDLRAKYRLVRQHTDQPSVRELVAIESVEGVEITPSLRSVGVEGRILAPHLEESYSFRKHAAVMSTAAR
jgi:hypothetical protein